MCVVMVMWSLCFKRVTVFQAAVFFIIHRSFIPPLPLQRQLDALAIPQ